MTLHQLWISESPEILYPMATRARLLVGAAALLASSGAGPSTGHGPSRPGWRQICVNGDLCVSVSNNTAAFTIDLGTQGVEGVQEVEATRWLASGGLSVHSPVGGGWAVEGAGLRLVTVFDGAGSDAGGQFLYHEMRWMLAGVRSAKAHSTAKLTTTSEVPVVTKVRVYTDGRAVVLSVHKHLCFAPIPVINPGPPSVCEARASHSSLLFV